MIFQFTDQTEIHGKEIETVEDARDAAVDWQHWCSDRSMSYGELFEWQCLFTRLAERFGLTEEFVENGIL